MRRVSKILPLVNSGALFLFALACAALALQLRSSEVEGKRGPASLSAPAAQP